jgi:hypothetical protein
VAILSERLYDKGAFLQGDGLQQKTDSSYGSDGTQRVIESPLGCADLGGGGLSKRLVFVDEMGATISPFALTRLGSPLGHRVHCSRGRAAARYPVSVARTAPCFGQHERGGGDEPVAGGGRRGDQPQGL